MNSDCEYNYFSYFVLQSLDPLPMHGPELGVQPDDIEVPETELEPKHEVLENKDVRFVLCQAVITLDSLTRTCQTCHHTMFVLCQRRSKGFLASHPYRNLI